MSNENIAYVCVEISPSNECVSWEQGSGGFITPESMGILITYALIINVLAMGIRGMRESF